MPEPYRWVSRGRQKVLVTRNLLTATGEWAYCAYYESKTGNAYLHGRWWKRLSLEDMAQAIRAAYPETGDLNFRDDHWAYLESTKAPAVGGR